MNRGNKQGYPGQFEPAKFGVIELTGDDVKQARSLYLSTQRYSILVPPAGILHKKLLTFRCKAVTITDDAMTKMIAQPLP